MRSTLKLEMEHKKIFSELTKVREQIAIQSICLAISLVLCLCLLPLLLRTIRRGHLHQHVIVAIMFLFPVVTISTDPNKIDLNGETLIARGTALNLIGRPYLAENKQIFHQAYNISSILELFSKMDYLGQLILVNCANYVEKIEGIHFEDTSQIETLIKGQNIDLPKYLVINKTEHSIYEAQVACEDRGLKLPEPSSDEELTELGQLLKRHNLPRVAVGTIFDFGIYAWRYKHSGKIPNSKMFSEDKTWYAHDLKEPEKKADLQWRIDDRNSMLYVENSGKLVFRTSGPDLFSNGYIEQMSSFQEYLKNKLTPVVCQTDSITTLKESKENVRTEKQIDKHRKEWARTIDLCKATGRHVNMTALVLMNQFARIVNQAGLVFEDPTSMIKPMRKLVTWTTDEKDREKRVIWAQLAKMLTFVPGLAMDIYKEYVVDRRLNKAETNIEELTKTLKMHATNLNTIEVQVSDLQKLTQEMTSVITKLYRLVTSLADMHAVTQILSSMMLHHQELVIHAQDSLGQLDTILTSLLNQKIPVSMTSNIKRFASTRDSGVDAFMLSPEKPIGVDPVIKNNIIHVYTTFLEGKVTYDLYQILALPYFEGETSITRQLPYEFVLVDGSQTVFAPVDKTSALFCAQGVCPVRHVLSKISDDKCGIRALTETPFDKNCPIIISTNEPKFYQTSKGIIYSVPKKFVGQLSCKGKQNKAGIEGKYSIEGTGILSIPTGCDITIVNPDTILQGPIQEIFRTITDLELIKSNFDGMQWSARALDLSNNLTQITQKWISNKIESHTWYFYIIIISIIIVGLILISIIVLKIWVVAKSYQKWKNVFKGFRENINGEVQRVKYLVNTFWNLLNPLGQEEVNRHFLADPARGGIKNIVQVPERESHSPATPMEI